MDRLKALDLVQQILLTRPQFKGFLKTKEETVFWVMNQIYIRGFKIVIVNPNPRGFLSREGLGEEQGK